MPSICYPIETNRRNKRKVRKSINSVKWNPIMSRKCAMCSIVWSSVSSDRADETIISYCNASAASAANYRFHWFWNRKKKIESVILYVTLLRVLAYYKHFWCESKPCTEIFYQFRASQTITGFEIFSFWKISTISKLTASITHRKVRHKVTSFE